MHQDATHLLCLNITWKQKLTNRQLNQDLPAVLYKVSERKMKLINDSIQHPQLIILYSGNHQKTEQAEVNSQSPTVTTFVKTDLAEVQISEKYYKTG